MVSRSDCGLVTILVILVITSVAIILVLVRGNISTTSSVPSSNWSSSVTILVLVALSLIFICALCALNCHKSVNVRTRRPVLFLESPITAIISAMRGDQTNRDTSARATPHTIVLPPLEQNV
ncbi:unnamed protein product [Orchesella dallaii]|uniref:Uncharacterized protein n=1 Tax=Orchesella dallaii TaxID=48710 RepID=A0ABP1S8X5_9HEXA